MARRIRNSKLDTRTARRSLAQRREPYWAALSGGLALGYRKGASGGTWVARHYAGGTRRYKALGAADDVLDADGVTVLTFDHAQDAARAWLAMGGADAAGGGPQRGPYTVNRAADDYLAFLATDGRTEAAIRDARYRIDAHIRPALGARPVAALQSGELRRWRSNLAKAGPRLRTRRDAHQKHRADSDERARKASANRTLTTLKALLNFAFDEGRAPLNTAWGRRVPPYEQVEIARVRYLQLAQAKALVKACEPEFRLLVTAALMTGARYSELARLTVGDFNPDAGTVFIALSKGGRARHVILNADAQRFFREVCADRPGAVELMFQHGGGPWLKSHQARPMREASARAKIEPPIGFHILRHTYASLLVLSGAPLHAVALNLGHVTKDGQPDVRMVTRHYAHFEKTYIAQTIRMHAPRLGKAASSPVRSRGQLQVGA
jgi:integrase